MADADLGFNLWSCPWAMGQPLTQGRGWTARKTIPSFSAAMLCGYISSGQNSADWLHIPVVHQLTRAHRLGLLARGAHTDRSDTC